MEDVLCKTLFEHNLSDEISTDKSITREHAEKLFKFFMECPVFRWKDANNDCEDRANAICMLLDEWKIPNYKGWVFSGEFLKKGAGSLANLWNYHVAAAVPVKENEELNFYIIDPATSPKLETVAAWADNVTHNAHSYHLIKSGHYYIFKPPDIKKDNWYKRNKRNYNWTMQGLSGINGLSNTGRAQLCFRKQKVKNTYRLFCELKKSRHKVFGEPL
jgi:hypothetical protein